MILAEKITALRKRSGWSQEELAMKLNVSRQSVSKWEAQQALPETAKIIMIANIFNVSIDEVEQIYYNLNERCLVYMSEF